MERMEILGDAFLKYSVGLFLHYKMTNDPASGEYTGWSYGEGDLSSARSRVVSNKNLCQVAEALLLPQVGQVARWPVSGPHLAAQARATWVTLYWRSGPRSRGRRPQGPPSPPWPSLPPQGAMRVERVELDCTWLPPGYSCPQVT